MEKKYNGMSFEPRLAQKEIRVYGPDNELVDIIDVSASIIKFGLSLPESIQGQFFNAVPENGQFARNEAELKVLLLADNNYLQNYTSEEVTYCLSHCQPPKDSSIELLNRVCGFLGRKHKLVPLREHHFETLNGGCGRGDWFTARYLPGRNVVVVTATELSSGNDREQWEITAPLQTHEFNKLMGAWERLQADILLEEAEGRQNTGEAAYDFISCWLCDNGLNAVAQTRDLLAD